MAIANPPGALAAGRYTADQLEVFVQYVLQRATTRAALAAAHARGRNHRNFADQLAVEAMRDVLDSMLPIGAEVVIGEGERDHAPMLYIGERLGPAKNEPPQLLIAVDPLEGTNLCAHWMPGAITVIAAALVDEGLLWRSIDGYMDKLVVGKSIAEKLQDLRQSARRRFVPNGFDPTKSMLDQEPEALVNVLAWCTGKPRESIVMEILDRPRNKSLIEALYRLHVQVRLLSDGDVAAAWRVLQDDSSVDCAVGIGASPEGVIAAAMANVMGGYMEGRCWFEDGPRGDEHRSTLLAQGVDISRVRTVDDLASGHVIVAFSAVTDGVGPGVHYQPGGEARTYTVSGRSRTGTHYVIDGHHQRPPEAPLEWPRVVFESK